MFAVSTSLNDQGTGDDDGDDGDDDDDADDDCGDDADYADDDADGEGQPANTSTAEPTFRIGPVVNDSEYQTLFN